MGQTILLIQFALKEGENLVKALLEQPDFDLKAAFWRYDDDLDKWHLVIATPILDNVSTHQAYVRIIKTMDALKSQIPWMDFTDIYAKSPEEPLVKALREAHPHPFEAGGEFIRGERLGGTYVDEAYLYYAA